MGRGALLVGALLVGAGACSLQQIPDLTSGAVARDGGGGVIGDASTDASDSGDAGSTLPFCKRAAHDFCDDFDRDGAPETGWSRDALTDSSKIEISTVHVVSPPASLRGSTPSLASGAATEYASLVKQYPGAWRHIVIEFDVWLEKPAWAAGSTNAGIFCLAFYSGADESGGSCVSIAEGNSYLGSPKGNLTSPPLPNDQWVHIKVDFDPGAGRISGMLGTSPLTGDFSPLVVGADPSIHVQVGLQAYNKPVPAFTAWFDNVTIDFP